MKRFWIRHQNPLAISSSLLSNEPSANELCYDGSSSKSPQTDFDKARPVAFITAFFNYKIIYNEIEIQRYYKTFKQHFNYNVK